MSKIIHTLAALAVTTSSFATAAIDQGIRPYEGYGNGPNLPPQTIFLPAYEGNNVVFYHDSSQVTLSRTEIDTLVNQLDGAMQLYRDYGGLDNYPILSFDNDEFPGKGSVTLRAGPVDGFAAGLGLNGKSEIFKFWFNENAFNNFPTDIRSWEVGIYELGRGTHFDVYDYFRYRVNDDGLFSGFPRFITYSTLEDFGIDHSITTDPNWQSVGVNPNLMNAKLQALLVDNTFMDFYTPIPDPNNVGQFTGIGHITSDLDGNGLIEGDERIGLNDTQATVLYSLRHEYGVAFMQAFFDFASLNVIAKRPQNNLEAVCNIVDAGNYALEQTSGTPASDDIVGKYLIDNFKFPKCVQALPDYNTFDWDNNWQNTGDFAWLNRSGTTPSSNTGPSAASHGSVYAYLETSVGAANTSGDTAFLTSPIFSPEDAFLSFKYHMYGSNMGTLSVEVLTSTGWQQVWQQAGQAQGSSSEAWKHVKIALHQYTSSIQVRIKGEAAGGWQGDMAIDNIRISNSPEIRQTSFDGDWFYLEWEEVNGVNDYTQFIVGVDPQNNWKWQMVVNPGADDRGDFLYQYYHRNGLCAAMGSGTFDLFAQIWPDSDSSRAVTSEFVSGQSSITCP